ncbi:MAG: glucose 1-dehydrogenase [Actinobacteria bacterium]|nr:glucose 1-dehydrogenase [Actinomycetota bacterium]
MGKMHEGKVALITGGSSGLGLSTAIDLAMEGAKIAIVGRRTSALDEAEKEIIAHAPDAEVLTISADVSSEEGVKKFVDETVKEYGRIDYFFNNAGIEGTQKSLLDYDMDDFREVININLLGVAYGLKAVLEVMVKQGSGSIVNSSSVGGLRGVVNQSPYVASKHAVAGMTKNMAAEYGKLGIRINAIAPGAIKTPMVAEAFKKMNPADPEGAEAAFAANNPTGRLGLPFEVAYVVSFLFSDKASYVNGQIIAIDGGQANQY